MKLATFTACVYYTIKDWELAISIFLGSSISPPSIGLSVGPFSIEIHKNKTEV